MLENDGSHLRRQVPEGKWIYRWDDDPPCLTSSATRNNTSSLLPKRGGTRSSSILVRKLAFRSHLWCRCDPCSCSNGCETPRQNLGMVTKKTLVPAQVAAVELGGVRGTILAVPMRKEDELIGSFTVYRQEVRPFTDKQIALVTNFRRSSRHCNRERTSTH